MFDQNKNLNFWRKNLKSGDFVYVENIFSWRKNKVSPESQSFGESQRKFVSIAVRNSLSRTTYYTEKDNVTFAPIERGFCPKSKMHLKNYKI